MLSGAHTRWRLLALIVLIEICINIDNIHKY